MRVVGACRQRTAGKVFNHPCVRKTYVQCGSDAAFTDALSVRRCAEKALPYCGIRGGASVNQRKRNAEAARKNIRAAMPVHKSLVLRSLRDRRSDARLRRAVRVSTNCIVKMRKDELHKVCSSMRLPALRLSKFGADLHLQLHLAYNFSASVQRRAARCASFT